VSVSSALDFEGVGARSRSARLPATEPRLERIRVCPGVPYFETESGVAWTPIGHNDAITWPTLNDAGRSGVATAAHFAELQSCGVTCLRLMLEYVHHNNHFFERPAGRINPNMVRRWDRLIALASQHNVRLLLTPFDTFWMWKRSVEAPPLQREERRTVPRAPGHADVATGP
jgi:hypothetical protein